MSRVLSLHYTLTDPAGKVIDSSKGKDVFSFMEGAQQIISGLEKQLEPLKKGDKKKIQVPAAEATLDGNHPLAGIDLTFDVELVEVREATAEEIAHGHAHGQHGHSH